MKRFWIGYSHVRHEVDMSETDQMYLYDEPSETYREAADRAEDILKRCHGKLYVLELVSCVQAAGYKWTHHDDR